MASSSTVAGDVERFESDSGVKVYRIACDAFPRLVANVYLLVGAGPLTLVDTCSGFGPANQQLVAGLARVREEFKEPVSLTDVRRVIITHGHIDHIGGLPFVHEQAPDAEILVHELDVRILTAYDERVAVAKKAIHRFLLEAGVRPDLLPGFMDLYGFSKKNVRGLPVSRTLVDGMELDGLRFIHTPGHCPGQVCIGVGDVLLTADHVLDTISPHQSPESIMPYTGLGHYLDSLEKIAGAGGFDLALGGHGRAMPDFYKRVSEIKRSHARKLDKVLTIIRETPEPLTTSEISKQLYRFVKGFDVLLAIEETAAHVEYLYQHGKLAIANLDEYQREENAAVRYVAA